MTQAPNSAQAAINGHADKPCLPQLPIKLARTCIQLPEDIQDGNENRNYAECILHRFSEEKLLRIIAYLDGCSVECLRRTARLFFRLCPVVFPDHYVHWVGGPRLTPDPTGWPAIRSDGLLKSLLQKDMFCFGCRQARQSRDWQQRVGQMRSLKKCHRCLKRHPACLFSKRQRHLPESSYPHCIAHEGFLRLCEHKVLTQKDLLNTQGKEYSMLAQCLHPSHTTPNSMATGSHEGNGNYARAMLVGNWRRGEEQLLILSWQQHLARAEQETFSAPEPEQPANQCKSQPKPNFIRQLLSRVWGWLSNTNLHEPNTNDTIDLNRRDTDADENFAEAGNTGFFNWWGGMEHLRYLNQQQNGHRFQMSCSRSRCPFDRKICQMTLCQRQIELPFYLKVSLCWYQALDPESYNLRHDTDGLNVYWCHQEGCKNYYMSSLSRMLKEDEYDYPLETTMSTS